MSVDIFDLIVTQIEEQKGQDYVEYVLPPHRVRLGWSPTACIAHAGSLDSARTRCSDPRQRVWLHVSFSVP